MVSKKKQQVHRLNYDIKTSVVSQFYRDVKSKIHRKLNPQAFYAWMKHKEIDLITELLLNQDPSRCLEWGTGFSTVSFPKWIKGDFKWLSIEHDQEWAEKISKANQNPQVTIKCIPPDQYPFSDQYQDGSSQDMESYIQYPESPQDFILVDGRARSQCVRRAYDLLARDGVVILHDANRKYYHQYFSLFKHQALFLDYHTSRGGIWMASREKPLSEFVNLAKHQKIWKIHYKFGRFFKKIDRLKKNI
ncbi:MAG: hypothetical protein ACNS62_08500 [Candidatus Cyclobacteriaceae bacterium M3_2C_046]